MNLSAVTFKSGKSRVQMNDFHDMIPTIWAYISLLDHDLAWRWPSAALTRRRMISRP